MSVVEEKGLILVLPDLSCLWAVADVDGLFLNDHVSRLLQERGVEIVVYDDPMAFRMTYESAIYPGMHQEPARSYAIVFDPENDGFQRLPADIYQNSKHLEVSLKDVFPRLSRSVLRGLDPPMLGKLWGKQQNFPAADLGDQDTADIVLRIGYHIDLANITTTQNFILALVQLHFAGKRLPDRLALRLENQCNFESVDSKQTGMLIRDSGIFWQFLQDHWQDWLAPATSDSGEMQERAEMPVSFDNTYLRVWMDNLFLEGYLEPIPESKLTQAPPHSWCEVGIHRDEEQEVRQSLADQRRYIIGKIPQENASYLDWKQFALGYAAFVADLFSRSLSEQEYADFWNDLWSPADDVFQKFARTKLESLANLPPTHPVMVHHIAPFLSRRVNAGQKVALLVFDGLSLSQWRVLRKELAQIMSDVTITEDTCFTLMPSITNVCRQSIFSGELPSLFESSIERTDYDGKRWKNFWNSTLNKPVSSGHDNVMGQSSDLSAIDDMLEREVDAIGLTLRMPDELVHGAKMGWRGLHEQLKLWANKEFLSTTIHKILDAGYELYVTSDHGNIEAIGNGAVAQGALVDRSGQRSRIYSDQTILEHTALELEETAYPWKSHLLPKSYAPLVKKGRFAFLPENQIVVCHGGASLDELLVPFVKLSHTKSL